uniref:CC domain-containing protein n=1 Tax=Meloidogyne hapla TaxID=6305 RepID=A0A1I8AZT3_MELHA
MLLENDDHLMTPVASTINDSNQIREKTARNSSSSSLFRLFSSISTTFSIFPPLFFIFIIVFIINLLPLLPFVQSTLILVPSSSFTNISSSLINSVDLQNHSRVKRQWWPQQQQQQMWPSSYHQQMEPCPPQCFGCQPMNCQSVQCMQPQMVNMVRCCCRPAMIIHPQPDLKTACDGEEAVAACMNGLCGQGFFCNHRKFCCRCPIGRSLGNCIHGLCPTGYVCNSNNFCCAAGAGSVIGPCVNDKCPEGYECGAGNLCYARTSTTNINNNNLWGAEAPKTTKQPLTRQFPLRPRTGGSGFGFVGNRQRLTGDRRTSKRRRLQQAKKRMNRQRGWGWGTGDDLFEPFADDWQQDDENGEEEIEGGEEIGSDGVFDFWG